MRACTGRHQWYAWLECPEQGLAIEEMNWRIRWKKAVRSPVLLAERIQAAHPGVCILL